MLNDNNDNQNDAIFGPDADEPYFYEIPGFSITNRFRGGDSITGLTGAMSWAFGEWRVTPTPEAFDYTFVPNNARPAAPDPVGGTLQVASFNVLNYFTTLDTGAPACGPSGTLGCRGANSSAELDRQRDKIVSALATIDADVVGLVELENNGTASLSDLVGGLNAVVGTGTYDFVDTGTIGTDAIKVGFIYKPAVVAPVGDFAILDSSVDPRFIDTKNRPVLIQTFEEIVSAARVTVAVNHLKSKGSSCDDVGDPNLQDGQGNCNQTRTDAVAALVDYLATDPTGSHDPDFLILGDLNAYAMEDPISTAESAGYTNLIETFNGSDAYSFVFDGQLGYLDHTLSNSSLTPQVTGVTEWRINADEVNVLDYNDGIRDPGEASFERKSNALPVYEANAFRSSDHDPLVMGLDMGDPELLLQEVIDVLNGIIDADPGSSISDKLEDVVGKAETAAEELDKNPPDRQAAAGNIEGAVGDLEAAVSEGFDEALGNHLMNQLAGINRRMAQDAIDLAVASGGDSGDIEDAVDSLGEGDDLRSEGKYKDAAAKYKDALSKAESALP